MLSHLASPERLLLPPLESLCILLIYNLISHFMLLFFNAITNYFISSFGISAMSFYYPLQDLTPLPYTPIPVGLLYV